MKCPFRKVGQYLSGQNTGGGYPVDWKFYEDFDECIGEECAAFVPDGEWTVQSCALCQPKEAYAVK